jgi:thiol-disulfide isomerase/thioredoxin
MRRLLLLLILALTIAANAVSQSGRRIAPTRTTAPAPIQAPANPEPEAPAPKPAPVALLFLPESLLERRIRSLDDNSFRLADFHGKVMVINLWATWCGPCRREIPDYEQIRKEYHGRNVEFIALTTEDPAAASARVNKFVRDVNFRFRLGWADRETARTLMNGKGAIPQTLVIDGGGSIVNHWAGYHPKHSGPRLREAIDNALR